MRSGKVGGGVGDSVGVGVAVEVGVTAVGVDVLVLVEVGVGVGVLVLVEVGVGVWVFVSSGPSKMISQLFTTAAMTIPASPINAMMMRVSIDLPEDSLSFSGEEPVLTVPASQSA